MFSSPSALQAALSSAGVVGITVEAILTSPMSDSRAAAASPPTPPLPPTPGSPGGLLDEGGGDDLREEQGGGAKISGGSIAAIVVCVVLAVCLLGAVSYNKIILRTTFGRVIRVHIGRVEVRRPSNESSSKGDIGDSFTGGLCLVGSPKSGVTVEADPPTRKPTAEQYQVMQALELTPSPPSPVPPSIRLSAVPTDHLKLKTTDSDVVPISLDEVHVKALRRASHAGLAAASKAALPTRLSAVPTDHLSPETTDGGIVSRRLDEVHAKASRRASAASTRVSTAALPGRASAASTRVSTAALPGSPMRGMHTSTRVSTAALPGSPMRGMHTVVHKRAECATDSDHPEATAHSRGHALTNLSAASLPVATDGGPGEESQVPINISPAGLRGFANLSPDDPLSVYDPV